MVVIDRVRASGGDNRIGVWFAAATSGGRIANQQANGSLRVRRRHAAGALGAHKMILKIVLVGAQVHVIQRHVRGDTETIRCPGNARGGWSIIS